MTDDPRLQSIKRWFWKESENPIASSESFAHLYEETHLLIFRYIFGLGGGPLQEAEDLTAETYTRAWKTRQHFNGDPQAAIGWLLRIARNLVIDLSRRRKVRPVEAAIPIDLLVDPNVSPEMDVITRDQVTVLWKMLRSLSTEVREMLVLRYMLGWQIREIAAYLGKNENTVTVTIKRALNSLQKDWSSEKDHE